MGWGREEGRVEGRRGHGLVRDAGQREGKRVRNNGLLHGVPRTGLLPVCTHMVKSKFHATKH
jgi:hypothetical protein